MRRKTQPSKRIYKSKKTLNKDYLRFSGYGLKVIVCIFVALPLILTQSQLLMAFEAHVINVRAEADNYPVVLNEILPNPTGDDWQEGAAGEWVELYNTNSDREYDVEGWVLTDADDNQLVIADCYTHTGNTIVPALGFLVVFRKASPSCTSNFSLNNDGDTVNLYTGDPSTAVLIDSYTYTGMCGPPTPGEPNVCDEDWPENKSFARIPDGADNWVDPIPTPGSPNVLDGQDDYVWLWEQIEAQNNINSVEPIEENSVDEDSIEEDLINEEPIEEEPEIEPASESGPEEEIVEEGSTESSDEELTGGASSDDEELTEEESDEDSLVEDSINEESTEESDEEVLEEDNEETQTIEGDDVFEDVVEQINEIIEEATELMDNSLGLEEDPVDNDSGDEEVIEGDSSEESAEPATQESTEPAQGPVEEPITEEPVEEEPAIEEQPVDQPEPEPEPEPVEEPTPEPVSDPEPVSEPAPVVQEDSSNDE